MKKVIISFLAIGTLMASCSGNEAETKDAKEVVTVKTESTIEFNTINPESEIAWKGSHLAGIDPHNGTIHLLEASISVTDSVVTNAKFVFDMNSLVNLDVKDSTYKLKLENHLKNPDFFDVEKYSTSTFEVTNVERTEGDFNSKITGNLTMKDSVKSIAFDANITFTEDNINIKSSSFSIDRTKWGVNHKKEGTIGLKKDDIISNSIGFSFNVSLNK